MILVIAHVALKPDALDDFQRAVDEVVRPSRAETGSISYQVFSDLVDRTKVVFIEEWQDRSALDRHFKEAHFKVFGDKLTALRAAPPEVMLYEIESSRQL